MAFRILGQPHLRATTAALDGLTLRSQVIANNVANVDTPRFHALDVTFQQQLDHILARDLNKFQLVRTDPGHLGAGRIRVLATTDPRHLSASPIDANIQPVIFETPSPVMRNDGNTVDIEAQMANLAQTQMMYHALVTLLSNRISGLRSQILEGRG
jgi:flagellar basal-body rod protein FlgB